VVHQEVARVNATACARVPSHRLPVGRASGSVPLATVLSVRLNSYCHVYVGQFVKREESHAAAADVRLSLAQLCGVHASYEHTYLQHLSGT
jgi:hypothetical protein